MFNQEQALLILGEVFDSCNQAFDKQVNDAYLYGSYARGDYHEDSDIDILLTVDAAPVELPMYRKQLAHICSELSLRHDIMVSATVKPLAEFHRYASVLPFYKNVLREGVRYAPISMSMTL